MNTKDMLHRDANEPNEHEQGLVRVRLLRKFRVHEQFMNAYRTKLYVRVRLLRKYMCSRTVHEQFIKAYQIEFFVHIRVRLYILGTLYKRTQTFMNTQYHIKTQLNIC